MDILIKHFNEKYDLDKESAIEIIHEALNEFEVFREVLKSVEQRLEG